MIKFLILAGILYVVYIAFFKKQTISNSSSNKPKRDREKDVDTVTECYECKTYVSIKEAILVDGKYFCSKECVDAYNRS